MTGALLAFAALAAVLTVTPGLDTLLVLRATAAGGRAAGVCAAAGIAMGCLAWGVLSAAGVTALIAASRLAFEVLRVAGVAYLCWLGVRALWASRRRAGSDAVAGSDPMAGEASDAVADRQPGERWSAGRALRVGLTTNLLNPKVGVFYLSVLPPFLPDGVDPLLASLALAAVHAVEGVLWLSLLALLVTRAKGWLDRPSVRRRFEQVTGLVLVGFGLRLAFDPRPA